MQSSLSAQPTSSRPPLSPTEADARPRDDTLQPDPGPAAPAGLAGFSPARRAAADDARPQARQAPPQIQPPGIEPPGIEPPQAVAPDHVVIQMPAEAAAARLRLRVGGDTVIAGLVMMAMGYIAWSEARSPGFKHDRGPALGAAFAAGVAAVLMVYTCIARERHGAQAGGLQAHNLLRRLHLRGRPLGDVVRSFCDPGSPAAAFDWSAPGVFMDDRRNDLAADVSHVLARAFRAAGRNPGLVPALQAYADQLATRADLREALAGTVRDANAACDDRLGVSFGRLMLSASLVQLRDPATPPRDLVLVLALHAATQAVHERIFGLLQVLMPGSRVQARALQAVGAALQGVRLHAGAQAAARLADRAARPKAPSAELLLLGFQAVQSRLREAGLPVPEVFPENIYQAEDVRLLQHRVQAEARQVARSLAGRGRAAALVGLLQEHGGEDTEKILSARLDHLLAPERARLLGSPQGQGVRDADALERGSQQQQDYEAARTGVFIRAVGDALRGDGGLWAAPPAASPPPDAEAGASPGVTPG